MSDVNISSYILLFYYCDNYVMRQRIDGKEWKRKEGKGGGGKDGQGMGKEERTNLQFTPSVI